MLFLAKLGVLSGSSGLLNACGRSDSHTPSSDVPSPPAAEAPAPSAGTPLRRLQNALRNTPPPTVAAEFVTVTQGPAQSADPSIGADAVIYPVPRGIDVNPNPVSLANLPQVWGYRRDTWKESTIGYIGSATSNGSWYVPIGQWHRAATLAAFSACGLHFVFEGQTFEILFAGADPNITLVADGKYMAPGFIRASLSGGVAGAPLSAPNAYVRFDFGFRARRKISIYAHSSQGPCAIAIGGRDSIAPWERSDEPSFCAVSDSYGQARAVNWGLGGPFWEAGSLMGIPHLDLNAIGGTGYAPNNGGVDARNPGNSFLARVATGALTMPDLVLTAGGINDNNAIATPPLYDSAEQARAGFESAVNAYFRSMRAALPTSVLAAMGPWAPVESIPVDAVARSKADAILSALQSVAGPWVFLDNLHGGWINSAGARTPATGRGWQTGTGNIGRPVGDGNGDYYVSADGTHPTPAGCFFLGQVLASELRAAILAL